MLSPHRQKQLAQLIDKLGSLNKSLINWSLLDRALTHATFSPELNYEQLEFVGDAVIRLAAADFLFEQFPNSSEGELSAIRSVLVSDRTLSQIAESYGLGRYLRVAASAANDKIGEETRLAAAFEAVLAALYLSTADLSLVRPWLDLRLSDLAETVLQDPTLQNYKGALQVWTQAKYHTLPEYRITEIGQSHGDRERFLAEVWFQGKRWGEGRGQSKKLAEQAAAQMAYQVLQQLPKPEPSQSSMPPSLK
ncbi:MAG: ribonuclease III [Elainellaceae cyanobacterium]